MVKMCDTQQEGDRHLLSLPLLRISVSVAAVVLSSPSSLMSG
jgi:hypothetical protein